jgi:hypothetical protein
MRSSALQCPVFLARELRPGDVFSFNLPSCRTNTAYMCLWVIVPSPLKDTIVLGCLGMGDIAGKLRSSRVRLVHQLRLVHR